MPARRGEPLREYSAVRHLHPTGEVTPRLATARDRQEHWEEVFLFLEMWNEVARAWNNDTLLRLMSYARLEAKTERDLETGAAPRRAREP